jgi:hypothetical protein
MYIVIALILVLVLCGGGYGVSSNWAAGPAYYGGGIGTVLIILLILYLLGVL